MPDFTFIPDFVYEETVEFKTLISRYENGTEQRRGKWSANRKQFTLDFRNRTKTYMESVKTFFESKKGSLQGFTFQNINDDLIYNVRFLSDKFVTQFHAPNLYNFQLSLMEDK